MGTVLFVLLIQALVIWPVELLVIGEFPVEASLREAKDHSKAAGAAHVVC